MNRSSRPSRRVAAGFTLLELLASIAVSTIALAALGAAFLGVHRSFQSESDITGTVENARVSTDFLDQMLSLAGYGIDPRFAFDFEGAQKDNITSTAPYFVTDDLAFRYRDPSYLRRGSLGASGMTLTLDPSTPTFGVPLRARQPLLLACAGGQQYLAARINSDVSATTTAVEVTAYGTPFPDAVPTCLRTGEPVFVMLMREVRLRVRAIGDRAFRVAYRNFDDPASSEEYDPIAPDVEAFQVSYVMNRPTQATSTLTPPDQSGNANWILGDAAGESFPNPSQPNAPTYDTPYQDPFRFNNHPANIRAVRATLVLRGESRTAERTENVGTTIEAENTTLTIGNTPGTPPVGFRRTVVRTAVGVPNMASRSFFVPALKSDGETTDGNVWGG